MWLERDCTRGWGQASHSSPAAHRSSVSDRRTNSAPPMARSARREACRVKERGQRCVGLGLSGSGQRIDAAQQVGKVWQADAQALPLQPSLASKPCPSSRGPSRAQPARAHVQLRQQPPPSRRCPAPPAGRAAGPSQHVAPTSVSAATAPLTSMPCPSSRARSWAGDSVSSGRLVSSSSPRFVRTFLACMSSKKYEELFGLRATQRFARNFLACASSKGL